MRLTSDTGFHPQLCDNTKLFLLLPWSILAEIHHCRLTHLRTLLRTSNLPAADLALRCGFSDANRASIAFKKAFGVTVRDYRRGAARVE